MWRLPPYTVEGTRFTCHYQVYFRWHTHWKKPVEPIVIGRFKEHIRDKYGLSILRFEQDGTEFVLLVELKPCDSVSAVASKLKGQLSKLVEGRLGKGYFACTVGENTSADVEKYLARQETHHGYHTRVRSPVWQKTFDLDWAALQSAHAMTHLVFHVVLVTWKRLGTFTTVEAPEMLKVWTAVERVKIHKASFLPDHVHLALAVHPVLRPDEGVVHLMNAAQDLMAARYPQVLIKSRQDRLWQPAAYMGSYGTLHGGAVRTYMTHWRTKQT